nr:hypothetical protein B0A51_09392 [Rachicladosporium sp. CCFEE 5018]
MVSKKLRARTAKAARYAPIPAGPPPPAPMKRSQGASSSSLSSLDSSLSDLDNETMREIEAAQPAPVNTPASAASQQVPLPQQRVATGSRLAPRSAPIEVPTTTPTNAPPMHNAAMTKGEKLLEKYDGDVTRGKWNANKQPPLIKLPRSIRNRIYACLLVNRAPRTAIKTYKAYKGLPPQQSRDRTVQVQLDMLLDQAAINPDDPHGCPMIARNMGLLLSCKQIHTEANAFLYSHNVFTIRAREDKEQCFWHCHPNDSRCDAYRPCLVHVRNLRQIKHLYIIAYNPHDFSDRSHDLAARNLAMNLRLVSRCFRVLGVKLKTLKLRYMSRLEGQTDVVRTMMDSHPKLGKKPKNWILRSQGGGRGYMIKQGGSPTEIFKNVGVLDALRLMRGCAEQVIIRGDLPTAYLNEIKDMLTLGEGTKVENEEVAIVQEEEADGDDEYDHSQEDEKPTFWQSMEQQHQDDPVAMELCDQMKGRPIYSAAVLKEMFGPHKALLEKRLGRWRPS